MATRNKARMAWQPRQRKLEMDRLAWQPRLVKAGQGMLWFDRLASFRLCEA